MDRPARRAEIGEDRILALVLHGIPVRLVELLDSQQDPDVAVPGGVRRGGPPYRASFLAQAECNALGRQEAGFPASFLDFPSSVPISPFEM